MNTEPIPAQGQGGGPSVARISPEARYRAMVDAIKDYAIFLLDVKGRIATWNAGAGRSDG